MDARGRCPSTAEELPSPWVRDPSPKASSCPCRLGTTAGASHASPQLGQQFSQLEVIEIALSVFRFSSFVHQVQITETLIAVHAWGGREPNNHLSWPSISVSERTTETILGFVEHCFIFSFETLAQKPVLAMQSTGLEIRRDRRATSRRNNTVWIG